MVNPMPQYDSLCYTTIHSFLKIQFMNEGVWENGHGFPD